MKNAANLWRLRKAFTVLMLMQRTPSLDSTNRRRDSRAKWERQHEA